MENTSPAVCDVPCVPARAWGLLCASDDGCCSAGWKTLLHRCALYRALLLPLWRCKPRLLAAEAGLWRNLCVPVSDNRVAEFFGQVCPLLSRKVPPGEGAVGSYPRELGGCLLPA